VDRFRFAPPAFIAGVVPNANLSMTLYFEISPRHQSGGVSVENVSTNIADGSGIWQFTDTNTSALPSRSYRSYSH
jgi:hypothetical protein